MDDRRQHPGAVGVCLVLAVLSSFQRADATLGEGTGSIAKDLKSLSATKGANSRHTLYTVQEIASAGTTVREYLTPDGIVFALAWNGLVHPDLEPLLGSYAAEYAAARGPSGPRHGRGQFMVKTKRLVVETGGHMRDLRGRAYLPALLPKGVSALEIQ